MTRSRRVAFFLVLLTSIASPAAARAEWFVAPFLGIKFKGATNFTDLEQAAGDTKLALGGSLGVVSDGIFGVEVEFGFTPSFFQRSESLPLIAGSSVVTLMGSVIAAVPRAIVGESLRPYVLGGLGLMRVGIEDPFDVATVNSNLVGMNLGGGAMGPLTDRTAVRFELRYFRSLNSAENAVVFGETQLSFWRGSVAVMFRY